MTSLLSDLSIDAYVLCRNPRAHGFLDALFSLPDELLPEFWYELEPQPKNKRLYLDKDRDRLISETLEFGSYGAFEHEHFRIRADYFIPDRGLPHANSVTFQLAIMPNRKTNAKSVDIRPALDVFDHFVASLDCYYASAANYQERTALAKERALAALTRDTRNLTLSKYEGILGSVRSYGEAKLFFPGLYWRSVISPECAEDYGIDVDTLASHAIAHRLSSPGGSSLQFADNPDDWEGYAQALQVASIAADTHRCLIDFYLDEAQPRRLLSVQNWEHLLSEICG